MLYRAVAGLLAATAAAQPTPPSRFDLGSGTLAWTVCNANGSVCVPATVPGQVQLDLYAAGVVAEPYLDFGPSNFSWVALEPGWTWTTAPFSVPPPFLAPRTLVQVVAEGVDTVADVSLNGQPLWHNDNQHVTSRVTLRAGVLHATGNVLSVSIASPVLAAQALREACPGTGSPYCPVINTSAIGFISRDVNYLRKEQASFGWDFAPSFAPSGIHRPLSLLAFTGGYIQEVMFACRPGGVDGDGGDDPRPGVTAKPWALSPGGGPSDWACNVTLQLQAAGGVASDGAVSFTVYALAGGGAPLVSVTRPVTGLAAGVNSLTLPVQVPGVLAWWPNGVGDAVLYNASATFTCGPPGGEETSAYALRMGFRTASLEQPLVPGVDPSTDARLFYFTVNGRPFFSKGANWVPGDAFEARVTPLFLASRLQSMVEAGWNTLRVWGGGVYQSNEFYELAQAGGIFLWQEAAFACYPYNVSPAFLASVRAEVADNVARLQKYTLLIWGGNNEVEELNGYAPGSNTSAYYGQLDWGVVMSTVGAVDASRPLVGSSPSNGNESAAWPVAYNPSSELRGDMHVYEYACDCWDPECYPSPRFASEYGWQSYNSLWTMAASASPQWWYYWSPLMYDRDHHPRQPMDVILCKNVGENWRIPGPQPNASDAGQCAGVPQSRGGGGRARADPLARYGRLSGRALDLAAQARAGAPAPALHATGVASPLPADSAGMAAWLARLGVSPTNWTTFSDTLWMTQVAQAACMKTMGEHFRRLQSSCPPSGPTSPGCTSGSLYWMANDMWPAATKGSIEHTGRWKVAHNWGRQYIHVPLLVSPRVTLHGPPTNRSLELWLGWHPPAPDVPSGCVTLSTWRWDAGLVGTLTLPFNTTGVAGGSPAGGSHLLYNTTLADALTASGCPGCDPAEVLLTLSATDAACGAAGGVVGENFIFPAPAKNVSSMRDPGLEVVDVRGPLPAQPSPPSSLPSHEGRVFNVTLSAATLPAALVWLESSLPGHALTNGFVMVAHQAVVTWVADAREDGGSPLPTAGEVAASLAVWSLWDVADYGPAPPHHVDP